MYSDYTSDQYRELHPPAYYYRGSDNTTEMAQFERDLMLNTSVDALKRQSNRWGYASGRPRRAPATKPFFNPFGYEGFDSGASGSGSSASGSGTGGVGGVSGSAGGFPGQNFFGGSERVQITQDNGLTTINERYTPDKVARMSVRELEEAVLTGRIEEKRLLDRLERLRTGQDFAILPMASTAFDGETNNIPMIQNGIFSERVPETWSNIQNAKRGAAVQARGGQRVGGGVAPGASNASGGASGVLGRIGQVASDWLSPVIGKEGFSGAQDSSGATKKDYVYTFDINSFLVILLCILIAYCIIFSRVHDGRPRLPLEHALVETVDPGKSY